MSCMGLFLMIPEEFSRDESQTAKVANLLMRLFLVISKSMFGGEGGVTDMTGESVRLCVPGFV